MRGIDRKDTGNKLRKILLQLDEIAIIERCDAGFQDLGGDEFTDVSSDGCGDGKLRDDAAENFDDHRASAGVTHAEGVCAKKNQGFKDYWSLKDESSGSRAKIVCFCTAVDLNHLVY